MTDTASIGTDTTDPDEVVFTTKINGKDKPVTRAQAIRYAQQVGSMAEQAATLAKRQEDLEQWDRFSAGFERDPEGTMAQLATAAGGSYVPRGGASKGAADDDDEGEDPTIAELKAQIASLTNQVGQVFGDVNGFKAQTAIEKEIAELKTANPKMTDDEFRETITKVTTYNGLPLKEAYRLVKMEAIENGREPQGTQDQERGKLPITAGSGTPADRVGSDAGKLDPTKPLKQLLNDSWKLTASKLGISPDQ